MSVTPSTITRINRVSSNHPGSILKRLRVEHSQRQGFWLHNEARLHYIYHDFKLALREWRKQNHPDVGGDVAAYQSFNAACSALDRRFIRHGVGPQESPAQKEETRSLQAIRYRENNREKTLLAARWYYHRNKARYRDLHRKYRLRKKQLALLVLFAFLTIQAAVAGTTKKPFKLAWDARPTGENIKFYTVYEYKTLTGIYSAIGTVLYPAPTIWTIPKGTTRLTVYAVTASNASMESGRSADVVLKAKP